MIVYYYDDPMKILKKFYICENHDMKFFHDEKKIFEMILYFAKKYEIIKKYTIYLKIF